MSEQKKYRRGNYLINKQFQTAFAVRFLSLIILALITALGFFLYNARDTMTVGYNGTDVKLIHTADYFLPVLLLSAIGIAIITGIAGIIVLAFLSHRIAGPLYRFEMILRIIGQGDLTTRFKLRENDQFTVLADRLNELAQTLDNGIGGIKTQVSELAALFREIETLSASNPSLQKELEAPLREISVRLSEIQNAANHFKTSQGG